MDTTTHEDVSPYAFFLSQLLKYLWFYIHITYVVYSSRDQDNAPYGPYPFDQSI